MGLAARICLEIGFASQPATHSLARTDRAVIQSLLQKRNVALDDTRKIFSLALFIFWYKAAEPYTFVYEMLWEKVCQIFNMCFLFIFYSVIPLFKTNRVIYNNLYFAGGVVS